MNKLCVLTLVSLLVTAAAACGDDDTMDSDAGDLEHEGGTPHVEDGGDDEDLDASSDAG